MSAEHDRALLVKAEAIVSAGIPGVRVARVPRGLMIALPVLRHDGDLACLYLRAKGGRLSLADDGSLAPHLASSGVDMAAPHVTAALAVLSLRCDFRTYDLVRDVDGLEGVVQASQSMAEALNGFAAGIVDSGRLAA